MDKQNLIPTFVLGPCIALMDLKLQRCVPTVRWLSGLVLPNSQIASNVNVANGADSRIWKQILISKLGWSIIPPGHWRVCWHLNPTSLTDFTAMRQTDSYATKDAQAQLPPLLLLAMVSLARLGTIVSLATKSQFLAPQVLGTTSYNKVLAQVAQLGNTVLTLQWQILPASIV